MKRFKIHPLIVGIVPSVIFGFSFMFTSTLLNDFTSAFHLLAHRFNFAVVAMTVCVITGFIKIDFKNRKITPIILLSLFQPFLYYIFETYGIKHSSSSQAGIMMAFIPIAVIILATMFLKERPTIKQITFIVLSIAGVVTVNSNSLSLSGSYLGIFLLLCAVIAGAVYTILARKYSTDFTPVEITYIMMWAGAITFNIIAWIDLRTSSVETGYFEPLMKSDTLLGLGYLGVLSSVLAFFALNFVLSKIEASKATILTNLTTVVSIVAGVLILKESFSMLQLAGSIMIIAGVWGTANARTPQTA